MKEIMAEFVKLMHKHETEIMTRGKATGLRSSLRIWKSFITACFIEWSK